MSDDEFDTLELEEDNIDDDLDDDDEDINSLSLATFQKKNHNFNIDNYDLSKYKSVKNQPNTFNRLTKYERANILGIRAQQLTSGAPTLLPKSEIEGLISVTDIAKKELENNLIPLIITRPYPNGTYEYWKIDDLYTF